MTRTRLKLKNMQGAFQFLHQKFPDVRAEDGTIRIYDVDDTEGIVELLMQNGLPVSEIRKNKIGLEEYYIELMSKKEMVRRANLHSGEKRKKRVYSSKYALSSIVYCPRYGSF